MLRKIKRFLPNDLKLKLKILFLNSHNPFWINKIDKEKNNIFVFLGGFYQNLGDMAITYSQIKFLEKTYPDANVVAVPSTKTYEAVKTIRKHILPDDIITIIGGGNMSDLYCSLEQARLYVVKSFSNNKIISFPQTVDFSNTPSGIKKSKRSLKIYSEHNNLTIFVREPNSLIKAKKYFPKANIDICPDIVLSLNKIEPLSERTDVLCCLRSDKEQNLSEADKQSIKANIFSAFPNAVFTDTVDVALEDCTPERYEQTLENFWNKLRKSKVVITDRLHCMIFCAITGTPCVVLDNSNHKISGVYNKWLSDVAYIKLLSQEQIDEVINEAEKLIEEEFKVVSFDKSEDFKTLKEALLR